MTVKNIYRPGFRNVLDGKHDHFADFGWPETLTFDRVYKLFSRNSIANAAVTKTVEKCWTDNPWLLEKYRDGSQGGDSNETPLEKEIRLHFAKIRFWQKAMQADRQSLVGRFAGLILRLGDGKRLSDPVGKMSLGISGLVEIIPVWENQLTVHTEQNTESPEYGKPTKYTYKEPGINGNNSAGRDVEIHPDRMVIWSDDATMTGDYPLGSGYNDLVTIEKVIGAGGEGFWKNAKQSPALEIDKDADIQAMMQNAGAKEPSELVDKMNEQIDAWTKGFDKVLMLQGMKANSLSVSLANPDGFVNAALQAFAASWNIPVKILVGMQTGERASTEDAREWSMTCNSRRTNVIIPNITLIVDKLVKFNILPVKDWLIDWSDLTESSMSEKIERASKMAAINQTMMTSGELIFTPEEIREVVGKEPLSESEKFRDDGDPDQHSDEG